MKPFGSILVALAGLAFLFQCSRSDSADGDFALSRAVDWNEVVLISLPPGTRGGVLDTLMHRWRQAPGVLGVSALSGMPGKEVHPARASLARKTPRDTVSVHVVGVDYDGLDVLGLELVRGRSFLRDFPGDADETLINEALAYRLGDVDPVGLEMAFERPGQPEQVGIVVGVVKDFLFRAGRDPEPVPLLLTARPGARKYAAVRLQPGTVPASLAVLEASWAQAFPEHRFTYFFPTDSISTFPWRTFRRR